MGPSGENLNAPRAAFAHRDFRLYQGARFLSMIGVQMQSVAIGWQVYELTHRPLDLGYVGLAQFAPAAGLSLLTGHVADRFDRRKIVLLCYLAFAVVSFLLYKMPRDAGVVPIYALLFVFGSARAFNAPAGQALLPHLVPAKDFPNAIAWASSIWQIATILGPALGGIVYGAASARAVYAVCGSTSLCAAALVFALRTRTGRMESAPPSLKTLFAGVRFVWSQKIVLGAISLDLFAVLLGGAVALLPIFAKDVLHVGPWGLGILRSAPSAGAAAMAALMAYRPMRKNAGVIMFGCVALFGLATIVFGLSHSLWLSLVALVFVGAADMVSVVVRLTLVQLSTPASMRGRVSAVNSIFIGASNELGEFESGLTAAWLGAVHAVVLGGIGTLLVVALWAWMFPALRKIDRLDT